MKGKRNCFKNGGRIKKEFRKFLNAARERKKKEKKNLTNIWQIFHGRWKIRVQETGELACAVRTYLRFMVY